MKITFLGHASLCIETAGTTIIVDPFISGNPKNTGQVSLATLQPDFIFVTHAHQDHVLDVEALATQSGATIVSNYEIATYYENKGYKVHPMNHGGSWEFNFGTLKYVNAIHTSSFADGTYGGQPGGFVLQADSKTVYIAGDTALHMDMQLIPILFDLDLAILPIGDNFTMGVTEAIHAAKMVECKEVLGYHYDTFGFIEIDHKKAIEAFRAEELNLHLLPIGESITI